MKGRGSEKIKARTSKEPSIATMSWEEWAGGRLMIHNVPQIKSHRKLKQGLVGSPGAVVLDIDSEPHTTTGCIVTSTFSFSGFRRGMAGNEALNPAFLAATPGIHAWGWQQHRGALVTSCFSPAFPVSRQPCVLTPSPAAALIAALLLGQQKGYKKSTPLDPNQPTSHVVSPCGQNPPEPQSKTNMEPQH